MNLPCKVIEDILPLYHDSVCSQESREIVDDHLKDCEQCRKILSEIESDISVPKKSGEDIEPLKKIRSEWIKIKKKSLLKGILITLVAVGIVLGLWFGLTQWQVFPVKADKIKISEVSVLSSGSVAFHLLIDDGKELHYLQSDVDYEEGVAYLTPRRAVIEDRATDIGYFSLNDSYYYFNIYPFTIEELRDPDNNPAVAQYLENLPYPGYQDFTYTSEITKVCVGTKSDHIVVWEEGMKLPAASTELEERYINGWK